MNDENAFKSYIKSRLFQTYDFRVRVKTENYQDEAKVRCGIMTLSPLDFAQGCQELTRQIETLQL